MARETLNLSGGPARWRAAVELGAIVEATGNGKRIVKSATSYKRACREMLTHHEAKTWQDAYPRHLVALYALLHESVYGVAPGELSTGHTFHAAASAAKRLVRDEFQNDLLRAVAFVEWTWRREKARVSRSAPASRIGWRLQFVTHHLLTDYRMVQAQNGKRIR